MNDDTQNALVVISATVHGVDWTVPSQHCVTNHPVIVCNVTWNGGYILYGIPINKTLPAVRLKHSLDKQNNNKAITFGGVQNTKGIMQVRTSLSSC